MKKSKFLLMLALVAVVFMGCKGEVKKPDAKSYGSISGNAVYTNVEDNSGIVVCVQKTDGFRSAAVSRAAVTGTITDDSENMYTVTDSNGFYKFENLDAGIYTVYASSKNSSEAAFKQNVEVTANNNTNITDLMLVATGSIKGKILINNSATGNSGVVVYIPATSYIAMTSEDGSFVITGVPVGTYSLAISKGNFTYLWKNENVSVNAGETTDASSLTSITTEQITQGYNNDTSIKWLGSFDSADEISNPSKNDAYYNTSDGCYYIYDGTSWNLLSSTKTNKNVSCKATERGICFNTDILSNVTGKSTYATFKFYEKESGIRMIRSWTKETYSYNGCETYYPFVEAGKTYTFEVSATVNDYTIYNEQVTVKATGGLGEYKIENVDEYTVEITDKYNQRITGTPKFTENPNVDIVDQGVYLGLYQVGEDFWQYVYAQYCWFSKGKGYMSLKDKSDGYDSGWFTFDRINAMLSGHKYLASAQTILKVAGYQDNGQTYFYMNDYKTIKGDWGGEKLMIPVIYGYANDTYDNLPGEEITVSYNGDNYLMKGSIVEYGSYIYEPTKNPKYKDAYKAICTGWMADERNDITFPYTITPELTTEMPAITIDGKSYDYYISLMPVFELTYQIPVMDGENELGLFEFTQSTKSSYYMEDKTVQPTKEGYNFEGFYSDETLSIPLKEILMGVVNGKYIVPTKIYTKWSEK